MRQDSRADMQGFTLLETLVVMLLLALLISGGTYAIGQQHALTLEQTAKRLENFLHQQQQRAFLENSTRLLWFNAPKCLGTGTVPKRCHNNPAHFIAPNGIVLSVQLSKGAGFYGLRNNALAGHIELANNAGRVKAIWSVSGRIRLCAISKQLGSIVPCNSQDSVS